MRPCNEIWRGVYYITKRGLSMSIRSCVLFASLACCSLAFPEEPFDFDIQEVRIAMSDGGSLAADVYVPGDGKFPTVLTITMSTKQKCPSVFYRATRPPGR